MMSYPSYIPQPQVNPYGSDPLNYYQGQALQNSQYYQNSSKGYVPALNNIPQLNTHVMNIVPQHNIPQTNMHVHNVQHQQDVLNQGYVMQVPPYEGYQPHQGYVPQVPAYQKYQQQPCGYLPVQQVQNQYQQPETYVHPYEQQYARTPPKDMPRELVWYKPLVLPPMLHPFPEHYLDLLPRYNGEQKITAQQYLDSFHNYMEDLNVQFEDVYMRLFVQSLAGEPMKSFQSLPISSIYSWEMLEGWFYTTWGKTKETNLTNKNPSVNVSQVSEVDIVRQGRSLSDGAFFEEGTGTGVRWLAPEECEELASGVEEARATGIQNIDISTNSELVVQQVNNSYQNEHHRMNTFKTSSTSHLKRKVEMLYSLSIPESVHSCQVLEDDEQIDIFLENIDESTSIQSSYENQYFEEQEIPIIGDLPDENFLDHPAIHKNLQLNSTPTHK